MIQRIPVGSEFLVSQDVMNNAKIDILTNNIFVVSLLNISSQRDFFVFLMLNLFKASIIAALAISAFLIPAAKVNATSLFADGFESGDFSNWTSSFAESGLTLQVNTNSANSGVYGLQVSTSTTVANDDAYVRKQLTPSQNELYTRFMLKLNSDTSSGNHQLFFSTATGGDGGHVTSTAIRRTSKDNANNLYTLAKGSWQDTGLDLNINTWYCVETRTIV